VLLLPMCPGLLELGNVINALTEGTRRKHVPYRNSKLTRVLQVCVCVCVAVRGAGQLQGWQLLSM
jgi:hypothetical protein